MEIMDHTPQTVQAAVGKMVEILPLLHDVQVVGGGKVERVQDLVHHVGMLTGETEAVVQKPIPSTQRGERLSSTQKSAASSWAIAMLPRW